MAGNLLDNACKWAATRVRISARRDEGERRPFLTLAFDDDGPGLPPEGRERRIVARNAPRRDEARLRPRPFDRGGARARLWRQAQPRRRRARGLERATDAAGGGGMSTRLLQLHLCQDFRHQSHRPRIESLGAGGRGAFGEYSMRISIVTAAAGALFLAPAAAGPES